MKFCTSIVFLIAFSLVANAQLFNHSQTNNREVVYNSNLKLNHFLHGVASGDPTQNSVILWTRISGQDAEVLVNYRVAEDVDFDTIIAVGTTTTSGERDYTVKLDIQDLSPGTTYYYQFQFEGEFSPIGRTRTASADSEHIRFGVVSCSNFQAGYFNAYKLLAQRADLDAIIHLGDYIYEYGKRGENWDSLLMRGLEPEMEILTLIDYRTRYAFYRMDEDLQAVHQQHPMIAVWDDHETANDAYKDGAQNHTPETEGDWEARKAFAKQAWFEWLPARDNTTQKIYRSIDYGNLLNLTMLDTRLEGRVPQIEVANDTALYNTDRTMLGEEQLNWFKNELLNNTAQWHLIGNQVIFGQVEVPEFGDISLINFFYDTWVGYPTERDTIINFIENNNLNNIVIATGDFHITFAADIAANPFDTLTYNTETGEGSVFVEMAVPSVTNSNFDEFSPEDVGGGITPELLINFTDNVIPIYNPHFKKLEVISHGYGLLDITTEATQVDYFYTDTLYVPSNTEIYGGSLITQSNNNFWQPAAEPSAQKADAPDLAPNDIVSVNEVSNANIIGVYPNPAQNYTLLNLNLQKAAATQIKIITVEGREVKNVFNGNLSPGFYSYNIDVRDLSNGIYFIQVISDEQSKQSQFAISH